MPGQPVTDNVLRLFNYPDVRKYVKPKTNCQHN